MVDVRRQSRHETGCGKFIDIGKRECLDISKHRIAQVACKACACFCAESSRHHAAAHRQQRHDHHQQACFHNMPHVADGDALVDNRRRHVRNQDFQNDAQNREYRRKKRILLVLPDLPAKLSDHGKRSSVFIHRFPPLRRIHVCPADQPREESHAVSSSGAHIQAHPLRQSV